MLSEEYRKDQSGIWLRTPDSVFNYSDGDEVEDRLLQQISAAEDVSLASDELQRLMVDWPSEYHFSPLRANLLSPFNLKRFPKILEIGSGCGAITRQLGETCPNSNILALEGSVRRAQITLARCRGLENVEVCCDSFADFTCEERFDLITLIGVLEYSPAFFESPDPIQDALNRARLLLNEKGVLVVAIENQLGLKYFNGCAEDHTGRAFWGINDQYLDGPVKTLGKKQLQMLFNSVGFQHVEFVYPFPDYKLPQLVFREEAIENDNFDMAHLIGQYPARDYSRAGDKLFRESRAWKLLVENGLIKDFSNSFLIFACSGNLALKDFTGNWLSRSFCGQRKKQYLVSNEFCVDADQINVCKHLSYPTAKKESSAEPIVTHHIGIEEYRYGEPYGYLLIDRVTEDNPLETYIEFLRPWVNWLIERSFWSPGTDNKKILLLPGTMYDCIPTNFIVDSTGQLTAIDQEWEFTRDLELGFILFRGVLGGISSNLDFFEEIGMFSKESVLNILEKIFEAFNIPFCDEIYQKFLDDEVEVQYELVPYNVDRTEFRKTLESFFTEERTKKSTLSDLIRSGSVRHYDFLSRQYDYWLEEGKVLHREIQKLDKERQQQRLKLEETEQEKTKLVQKVYDRNADISNLQKSFSWKLTEPLRLAGYVVKGDFTRAGASGRQIKHSISDGLQKVSLWLLARMKKAKSTESADNFAALEHIVASRCNVTASTPNADPLSAAPPDVWPAVDISAVTYNSEKWIDGFVESLLTLDYPKAPLTIHFVDNGSQDATVERIESGAEKLRSSGCDVFIYQRKNKGYGAGHNVAIQAGKAPFCLVTNVDLIFDVKALQHVVATAVSDETNAAAWELRQQPYEHPKFYDPVTGLTNWNSHACILFRRSRLESVGGYDETLFMYGEDVELSYRLRRSGAQLRYCPRAVVDHFSYDHAGQIKPAQYKGSTFANLYLRLKYGNGGDIGSIPFLAAELLLSPKPFKGARWATWKNLFHLTVVAPKTLLARKSSSVKTFYPFRTWDYELTRDGAYIEQPPVPADLPLVSIITRTYRNRELYLRQAMLSVAHQSYPNIEHIIVEDGGNTLQQVAEQTGRTTGRPVAFIETEKRGRSFAGNTGLQQAKGKYCMFLDDDDLLFGDHVALLVATLSKEQEASAAYSYAWEVPTDTTLFSEGQYREAAYTVPSVLQEEYEYETLVHHNLMAIQSILFKRSLFEERGGFDVDLEVLEDWVLWVCYGYRNKIIRVPKVTSLFRTPLDEKIRQDRQVVIDNGYQPAQDRAQKRIERFKSDVNASVPDHDHEYN